MKEKINCLVVDDEPLAIGLLEKHIQQFSQLNLVDKCWNAVQAFEVLKKESIDLIFLDIQMPGLTGIEFVKSLKNPPAVIFTTAYRDYAVESYELDVVDYLLKPITIDRFVKSVDKFLEKRGGPSTIPSSPVSDDDPFMYVNTNRKHIKVVFSEILYIESIKDYIRIYLKDQDITTKYKISEFEELLPDLFLRVHRSFIVNTSKIDAFTTHNVEIDRKEIPIGISYKKEVMRFLANTQ